MERTFYKPAMRCGKQFQVYIPKDVTDALEIKDRDELEVLIRKTDRTIPKSKRFFKETQKIEISSFKSAAANSIEVPREEIDRIFMLRTQGKSPQEIKTIFEAQTEYSWNDIPEKVIKELEKV